MDTLAAYRKAIEEVLANYAKAPYAHGEIAFETVFDHQSDRYLLLSLGWDSVRRVHGCLIHLDIIDGKVWVQRDGTEQGVANDLVRAGGPKERIVLGFHPADVRPHTEFAIA